MGILWGIALALLVGPGLPALGAPRPTEVPGTTVPGPPASGAAPSAPRPPLPLPFSTSLSASAGRAVPTDPRAATPRATGWYNVTAESATSVPPFESAPGAWDGADGYLLVYGGDNFVVNLGSTWAYRDGNWSEISPSDLPGPLSQANLAYDPNASSVVLFGGVSSRATFSGNNTTYTYRGGHWSAHPSAPAPPARRGGCMAYDPELGGVVLFGGAAAGPGPISLEQDLWLYRGGHWSRLPTPSPPPARWRAEMAYDPDLRALVLFGGIGANGSVLSDTWTFRDGNWSTVVVQRSPPPLSDGAMDFDAALGTIVLTGGQDANGSRRTESWTFNGTGWSPLANGTLPSPHDAGVGVYDPAARALVVTGGDSSGSFTDLLAGPVALTGTVPPRTEVNQSVALDLGASGGAPPFRYVYRVDWGDGSVDTGAAGRFRHAYAQPGAEGIAATATGSDGAVARWNGSVSVLDRPDVRIALGVPAADAGVPVNLSAAVTGGYGALALAWTLGDGGSATGTSVGYVYAAPGRFPVTVWANDSLGASSSATLSLLVDAAPSLGLPIAGFAADAGLAAPVGVSIHGGTPPFDVGWLFPDSSVASGVRTVHDFGTPGRGVVGLSFADAAGARLSETVPVVVAPALSVTVDGPSALSAGATGTWTAHVAGGTPPYQFAWTLPDGENGTGSTVRHLFNGLPGPRAVLLEVTDGVNASATAQANVTVGPGPHGAGAGIGVPETLAGLGAIVAISAAGVWAARGRRRRRSPPTTPGRSIGLPPPGR